MNLITRRMLGLATLAGGLALAYVLNQTTGSPIPQFSSQIVFIAVIIWFILSLLSKLSMIFFWGTYEFSGTAVIAFIIFLLAWISQIGSTPGKTSRDDLWLTLFIIWFVTDLIDAYSTYWRRI